MGVGVGGGFNVLTIFVPIGVNIINGMVRIISIASTNKIVAATCRFIVKIYTSIF
jgi:hypothetical protein